MLYGVLRVGWMGWDGMGWDGVGSWGLFGLGRGGRDFFVVG